MKITKSNNERIGFRLNTEVKEQVQVLAKEQNCLSHIIYTKKLCLCCDKRGIFGKAVDWYQRG